MKNFFTCPWAIFLTQKLALLYLISATSFQATAQNPLKFQVFADVPVIFNNTLQYSSDLKPLEKIRRSGFGLELEKNLSTEVSLTSTFMYNANIYSPSIYEYGFDFDDVKLKLNHLYMGIGVGIYFSEKTSFYFQPAINVIFPEFIDGQITNTEHGKSESLKDKKLHTRSTFYQGLRLNRTFPLSEVWLLSVSANGGLIRDITIIKDHLKHENFRISLQLGIQYKIN